MKEVLDGIVKNLQNLHQVGTKDYAYAKFSGKAGTINIKDWLNRMEDDHTPDMSDEVKFKNLLSSTYLYFKVSKYDCLFIKV